jgi:ribose 5-phosphate isomerase A
MNDQSPTHDDATARRAAAAAAAGRVDAGMAIGLGSGRAVWATIDAIATRLGPDACASVTAVCASDATERAANSAGLTVLPLMADTDLDLAIDGADELTPALELLKGGGGALLRERLVIASAQRFLVVAEAPKVVGRLGETRRLPIEIARFGATATARRLSLLVGDPVLRLEDDGNPEISAEGHLLLDAEIPGDAVLSLLHTQLLTTPGVMDHGLFLGVADGALVGRADGSVDELRRP